MIGLIFGETSFPIEILRKVKKKKLNYLIIDLTKSKKFKKDKKSYSVTIGQFGKIINILKKNKCKKILFAGKVSKPNFSKIKLDLKGIYYIPRIIKASKVGDAAILKEIINIFNEQSIKTVSSVTFNPELSLKRGNYSKIKPNKKVSIKNYSVESDWSSASYLYSIVALSGIELNLSSFKSNSLQGDSKISKLYENFGVKTYFKNDEIIIKRSKSHRMKKFIELDLIENPDLAQTIIVTSLGLSIHTKLTGLNTLKIKETDRLVALKNEISKFNTDVIIDDKSIEINNFPKVFPENIEIDTYEDHRMALAFSPLSVLVKLVINDYGVISKSFPEYWTILQKLNFDLEFDN